MSENNEQNDQDRYNGQKRRKDIKRGVQTNAEDLLSALSNFEMRYEEGVAATGRLVAAALKLAIEGENVSPFTKREVQVVIEPQEVTEEEEKEFREELETIAIFQLVMPDGTVTREIPVPIGDLIKETDLFEYVGLTSTDTTGYDIYRLDPTKTEQAKIVASLFFLDSSKIINLELVSSLPKQQIEFLTKFYETGFPLDEIYQIMVDHMASDDDTEDENKEEDEDNG